MKILFLAMGTEILASSRTRVYQYLPHLKKNKIKYKVINRDPGWYIQSLMSGHTGFRRGFETLIAGFYRVLQILRFLFLAPFYDVVFIQKVLLPLPVQDFIRFLNKNIVFDFDDAIYSKDIPSFHGRGKEKADIRDIRLRHQFKISKSIVIENKYTGKYASQYNQNVVAITGPIDADHYYPRPEEPEDKEVIAGWVGSPPTTLYLKPLYNVFKKLTQKYPELKFIFIGAAELKIEGVNLAIKKWVLDTEVADLQELDIGIMPLPDDEWTRGKGGYKLLQYMAIGIPCVASPVGINTELVQEGLNGLLAKNEEEWIDKLSRLIEDKELRQEMGKKAREIAVERYSFGAATPVLIAALSGIVENENE